MSRMRLDVFDESNRKRPAPAEPTDGLDPAKRQRVGVDVADSTSSVPLLPSGPVSYAQLFTLTSQPGAASWDVSVLPLDTVLRVIVPMLQSIDEKQMDNAINVREASLR